MHPDALKCKTYNKEHQIISNDPIGIHHVLAVNIWTTIPIFSSITSDLGDTSLHQLKNAQQQLSYFLRCLSEVVEFHGNTMTPNMTVHLELRDKRYFQ